MKVGYVFINGHGLVRFKSDKKHEYKDGQIQYSGKIKYPYGVIGFNGEKLVNYDYYFDESEIFASVEKAIEFIIKSQPKRG